MYHLHIRRKKIIPGTIGLIFVFLFALLLYINPPQLRSILSFLENDSYDLLIRSDYKPVDKNSPVVVVDIDDASLSQIGRWPWPRKRLGDLCQSLYKMGARVVAFDITFPEAEENPIAEAIRELEAKSQSASEAVLSELNQSKEEFNFDAVFAEGIKKGNTVLAFAFKPEGASVGLLPQPLFKLTPSNPIFIPEAKSYISNIPILQQAAKGGGFINVDPGSDGVIRYAPLLLKYGTDVYSSLALEGTRLYLNPKEIGFTTVEYQDLKVIEEIKIDNLIIPVNPWVQMLVPFRGPPYSFPYVSAADVLAGKADPAKIRDKLVFVGSSAVAIGDWSATAMSPTYPGVEVHASIALGIIDNYLPSRPAWGKGVATFIVLLVGILIAIAFPFLGSIGTTLFTIILTFILLFMHHWFWVHEGLSLPFVYPIFVVVALLA